MRWISCFSLRALGPFCWPTAMLQPTHRASLSIRSSKASPWFRHKRDRPMYWGSGPIAPSTQDGSVENDGPVVGPGARSDAARVDGIPPVNGIGQRDDRKGQQTG